MRLRFVRLSFPLPLAAPPVPGRADEPRRRALDLDERDGATRLAFAGDWTLASGARPGDRRARGGGLARERRGFVRPQRARHARHRRRLDHFAQPRAHRAKRTRRAHRRRAAGTCDAAARGRLSRVEPAAAARIAAPCRCSPTWARASISPGKTRWAGSTSSAASSRSRCAAVVQPRRWRLTSTAYHLETHGPARRAADPDDQFLRRRHRRAAGHRAARPLRREQPHRRSRRHPDACANSASC